MADRRKLLLAVALVSAGLFAIFLLARLDFLVPVQRAAGQNKSSATVTPADYLKWRNEFKNWGRWGADDQRGASKLITEEKSQSAVRLAKRRISNTLPE